jgi:hypothetical protein
LDLDQDHVNFLGLEVRHAEDQNVGREDGLEEQNASQTDHDGHLVELVPDQIHEDLGNQDLHDLSREKNNNK